MSALMDEWQRVLSAHFDDAPSASGPDGWLYRQRLLKIAPPSGGWEDLENSIPITVKGLTRGSR